MLNLLEKGYVFGPFLHGDFDMYLDTGDIGALRAYHLNHGYKHETGASTVNEYIKMFHKFKIGDILIIPCRYFNAKANKTFGYRVCVTSLPFRDTIEGHHMLFITINMLGICDHIKPGVLKSLTKLQVDY